MILFILGSWFGSTTLFISMMVFMGAKENKS